MTVPALQINHRNEKKMVIKQSKIPQSWTGGLFLFDTHSVYTYHREEKQGEMILKKDCLMGGDIYRTYKTDTTRFDQNFRMLEEGAS